MSQSAALRLVLTRFNPLQSQFSRNYQVTLFAVRVWKRETFDEQFCARTPAHNPLFNPSSRFPRSLRANEIDLNLPITSKLLQESILRNRRNTAFSTSRWSVVPFLFLSASLSLSLSCFCAIRIGTESSPLQFVDFLLKKVFQPAQRDAALESRGSYC